MFGTIRKGTMGLHIAQNSQRCDSMKADFHLAASVLGHSYVSCRPSNNEPHNGKLNDIA